MSELEYIEAPKYYYKDTIRAFDWESGKRTLFLAGGITNCPDWQRELVNKLNDINLIIFNPRRENFPIHDPAASFEQIKWEFKYLKDCRAISFWFAKGSLNPIVLFEYGRWSYFAIRYWQFFKKIFVGIDPEYKRKQDVEIQTKLLEPTGSIIGDIVYNIDDLAEQIIQYEKKI